MFSKLRCDSGLTIDLAYIDQLLGDPTYRVLRDGAAALPGLNLLAERHRLTAFDRDLLLLAATPNFDRKYVQYFERHDGEPCPSVGLLLAVLGEAAGVSRDLALSRLGRGAPLVESALVELAGAGPFAARRVSVPEVVWQRMVGIDEPTGRMLAPLSSTELVASDALRERIRQACAWIDHRTAIVVVKGPPETGRTSVVRAIATAAGRQLLAVSRSMTVREIAREARWYDAVPLFTNVDIDVEEMLSSCPVIAFVLDGADALPAAIAERAVQITTERLDAATRAALWSRRLGAIAASVDLPRLVDAYRFGPARIEAAAELAATRARVRGESPGERDVVEACQAVAPVAALRSTQRLPAEISMSDLVVPSATRLELELAVAWSRFRVAIRESTEAPHLRMVSGLTCLFSGSSGTGKTTAARALAHAIGLPIHRVDLSQVMDKYIGETEKHLGRLFDEAEAANVILFFDEADALFARRTEVRDAHDRFANVETGYLLQRLEAHPGIVILATNMRRNFDEAFARRIQVIVEFPMPGVAERKELWRRMLPAGTEAIDISLLATRFPFAGGDIRNAVVTALVLAGGEGVPLAMRHVMVATWREMQRSGRLASGGEFAGWHKELAPWLPEAKA